MAFVTFTISHLFFIPYKLHLIFARNPIHLCEPIEIYLNRRLEFMALITLSAFIIRFSISLSVRSASFQFSFEDINIRDLGSSLQPRHQHSNIWFIFIYRQSPSFILRKLSSTNKFKVFLVLG